MPLTSTFPDLSEDEALRELNPSGGSGGSNPPSNTPPPLPVRYGRLAGWISGLADTTNVSVSTRRSYSDGDPRPSSTTAGRGFCPNGAATTTTVPPAASSFVQPVSSRASRIENDGGRSSAHREGASAASSNNDGDAGTEAVGNHAAVAQPPKINNTTTTTLPSPFSTQSEHGHRLCCADGAGAGGGRDGEGSTSSPVELPLSLAGEDTSPAVTASRAIRRGDVVAIERPLAAAQSSQTLPWVAACPGCLRHVGTLETQLAIASGERDRAEAFIPEAGTAVAATAAAAAAGGMSPTPPEPEVPGAAACFRRSAESPGVDGEGGGGDHGCGRSSGGGKGSRLPPLEGLPGRFLQPAIPCSAGCGAIYCSEDCRRRCWELGGHSALCLGLVADEAHPLVQHKVHALTHPELEAPLLLAAALIVQAAQAVALGRLRRCTAAATSSTAPGPSASSSCPAQTPAAIAAAAAAAPSKRKRTAARGCRGGIANGPVASAAGCAAECPAPSGWPRGSDEEEEAATRDMMDELFPRGWLRKLPACEEEDGEGGHGSAAAVEESWALLTQALEAGVGSGLEGVADSQLCAGAGGDAVAVIDPRRFPLLLSRRAHERVVGGLAANLMEVEVRSPLVEYCEALVTQEAEVQQRALQVLEPALAAMEQHDEEDEGEEEGGKGKVAPEDKDDELDGHGRDSTADSDAECSPAETTTDSTSDTDAGDDAGTERRTENAPENGSCGGRDRSRERLAWRCVEAARAAESLIPPLIAHALLPAGALRPPHSCAPAVRVPAGDRRSYNARGGGGGGGGAAGRPLTVAMVALRDIPAGAPLSCAWVDAWEPFAARMSRLKEYCRVAVVPTASSIVAGPGGSEGPREVEGVGGCGGCGCPKCFVESHGVGGCRGDEARSDLGVERLLEAARQAVDEDRFDDAFDALRRAARAAPDSAEVLYRSGVCAINQGRWSRALRLWRDGLALSPNHRELRQEAEKYRALAFWLDDRDHDRGGNKADANETGSAGDAPPPFSSPPPRNGREADLVEHEEHEEQGGGGGGGGGGGVAASAVPAGGHESSAASAAAQQITENLDVEFMAGVGEWVCKTRAPPLSASECAAVVAEAEEKAAAAAAATGGGGGGSSGWGTARHYAVPTTDVAVRELPRALAWFNAAMRTRIGPIIAAAASLGDGIFPQPHRQRRRRQGFPSEPGAQGQETHLAASTPTPTPEDACSGAGRDDGDGERNSADDDDDDSGGDHEGESPSSAARFLRALRVHDAFVVRYEAAAQRSLPLHTDQGELSLTISLNSGGEYEGGGTWFEGLGRAVRPEEAGHVVVFPGGSTVHGGQEVTSGARYILAVFLYMHREEEEEEESGDACA